MASRAGHDRTTDRTTDRPGGPRGDLRDDLGGDRGDRGGDRMVVAAKPRDRRVLRWRRRGGELAAPRGAVERVTADPSDAPLDLTSPPTATVTVDGQAGTVVSVASARDVCVHQCAHHCVHVSPGEYQARRIPAQLPPDIDGFTGRRDEVARLIADVCGGHGVAPVIISAIDGKPGIGKSALAVHVAHRVAWRFPDGQLYVNLQGANLRSGPAADLEPLSPGDVLGRFIRALEGDDAVIPVDVEEAATRYRSLLAGKQVLVVLDDAADAAQLRPLLPAAPTCAVLVTSRSMLTELVRARRYSLDVLADNEAIELLGQLCGDARVRSEPVAAARIAELCGHLPLALRIAGARLATQPAWRLAAFADRLADERHRLDEFTHGDLDVAASFAISYRALGRQAGTAAGPPAAQVFRLLSLLPGPDFATPIVAALIEQPERVAEAAIERLVVAQLVEQSSGRFRLHDLLRLYASRCAEEDEPPSAAHAARTRVLAHYLTVTRQAAVFLRPTYLRRPGDDQGPFHTRAEALAWLDAERENLVAAARQAAEDGPVERSWQLAQALFRFFDLRGHLVDWTLVNRAALDAARAAGAPHPEATALRDLGVVAGLERRYSDAVGCFLESLRIFRALGNLHDEGLTLNHLVRVHRHQRQFDAASDCGELSLDLHRTLGDRHGQAVALDNLGVIARQQRRFDAAKPRLDEALGIFQAVGDRRSEANTLGHLGDVARHAGRYAEASTYYQQALAILVEVQDRHGEGVARSSLGLCWLRQGSVALAIEQFDRSLRIRREVDDQHGEGVTLYNLAEAYRALGRFEDAAACYRESLSLRKAVQHRHGEGLSLLGLAETYRALGRWDEAVRCYEESHAILVETADEYGAERSALGLAEVSIEAG